VTAKSPRAMTSLSPRTETADATWARLKQDAEAAMKAGAAAPEPAPARELTHEEQVAAKRKLKQLKKIQLLVKSKFKDKFKYLTEAFKWIDVDRTGTITTEELRFALEALNLRFSDEEFFALESLMDSDGDGVIGYTEFARAVSIEEHEITMQEVLATRENAPRLFKQTTGSIAD
jgi:hypothetical protein